MCLTIPGKIKKISEGRATVENGSRIEEIDLGIVSDAKVGDWVLYATDRAVRKIDEAEAREIIELLEDNYQSVDVSALPLEYKKIVYKIRSPKISKSAEGLGDNAAKNNQLSTPDNQSTINHQSSITKDELEYLLNLKGKNNLEALYSEANVLRKDIIKDFVCIHGIVEFSNYCRNSCLYCGIGKEANIQRYRMSEAEIFMTVKNAVENEGYKLVVLQSGEDLSYSDDDLVALINRIKKNIRVFVFISVGERSHDFYQRAYDAGASGSLFRFETSNKKLYSTMHPGHNLRQRLRCLEDQLKIGYYVASGGLIGLPGQTISDLADDLLLVKQLGIPMLSSGPWIESAQSPLSINSKKQEIPKGPLNTGAIIKQFSNSNKFSRSNNQNQKHVIARRNDEAILRQAQDRFLSKEIAAPSEESEWLAMTNENKLRLTLNYIAAARLLMPEIKIPVTTALETLDPENGRHKGLLAGANALMFNITPEKYRADYNLYDHKYIEREKVWQKYGLFKGEESYEMLEERLMI